MKLSHLLSTALLIMVIISGCKQSAYEKEMDQIDSLSEVLSQVEKQLNKVDSAKVNSRLKKQLANINTIQSQKDSITRIEAFIVDEYAQYKKAYSRWGEKIPVFYRELELRRNQLKDLKQDLKNEHIPSDRVSVYYSNEKYHIKTLEDVVNEMDERLNSIDDLYLKSEIRIDSILQTISHDTAQ